MCGKWGHAINKCHFRQMIWYKCGTQGHLQAVYKEQVRVPDKHTVKQLEPVAEQSEGYYTSISQSIVHR